MKVNYWHNSKSCEKVAIRNLTKHCNKFLLVHNSNTLPPVIANNYSNRYSNDKFQLTTQHIAYQLMTF